ncbi:MAG: DUF2252 domain-containing protein [Burkholderiales bacterium]|nr:DUF2252 domain-containing protein [Burkholderiales bacterium]
MGSSLYNSFLSKNPSHQERLDLGNSIRKQTSRSSLAEFTVKNNRQTPIDILLAQAKTRLQPFIPIRHARMAVNPFAFFRGGAAIMAKDLASVPSPAITVQLCGDMHVSNFGFFSTTEHQLVFGINDFDETLPGNFDWDLKRLTASAMIVSQQLGQDQVYGETIVRNICTAYRNSLHRYATIPYVDLKRTYIDEKALITAVTNSANTVSQKYLKNLFEKARKNTNHGVLDKLIEKTPHGPRFIEHPPLIVHADVSIRKGTKISELLDDVLQTYTKSLAPDRQHLLRRYKLIDWVRKVVGVGSVGTACWAMYFEGQDVDDPLFLQLKEAQKSVLAPYFPSNKFHNEGKRVIDGQALIQGAPDLFLGFGTAEGHFYIRQLRDMKGGISIGEEDIPAKEFPDFAKLFGWALANAHARSGDPAVLAGYCGKGEVLDDAMVNFSIAYSKQNEADYDTFLRTIKSGKISSAAENF